MTASTRNMLGCFGACFRDAGCATAATVRIVEEPKVPAVLKRRQLLKTAVDSLLFATTSTWRERLDALAGKHHTVVSLFIYSSDWSHAVVVHSAGPAAHRVPPGQIEATSHGFSHAALLDKKKPVLHAPAALLEPLPHDWQALAAYENAESFLLLPVRRGTELYGSVLVCIPEVNTGIDAPADDAGGSATQATYDLDELEQLSQYLSLSLLSNLADLPSLQLVANAATLIRRSLTIQDAVSCLVEAVQQCLRLSTRLEIECLPAVAFRSYHIAAFFRVQPPGHQMSLQDMALQHSQGMTTQPQQTAGGAASRSQSRTQTSRWLGEDQLHGGGGGGGSSSLAASVGSLHGVSLEAAQNGHVERDASDHAHMQQQQASLRNQQSPAQAVRARMGPAWLLGQRDSMDAWAGTQSPTPQSVPLPPPAAPGSKVRATTALLHQTLLGSHLELADATGSGHSTAGARISMSAPAGSVRNAMGPRVTAHSKLLLRSSEVGPSIAAAAAATGAVSGCGVSTCGSDHNANANTTTTTNASSRRALSVAVVPNCATFLMADERQPYKDVLHVQRMLPQARAHSLVMLVSGPIERQQFANSGEAYHLHLQPSSHKHQHQQQQQQQQQGQQASCALLMPYVSVQNQVGLMSEDTESLRGCSDCGRPSVPQSAPVSRASIAAAMSPAPHRSLLEVLAMQGILTGGGSSGGGGGAGGGGSAGLRPSTTCPPAALALYLIASESVPRAILEQVAEEAQQLMQVLHLSVATALTGPYLSAEWAKFCVLLLSKSPVNPGAGTGGVVNTSSSIFPASSLLATGAHALANMHSHAHDPKGSAAAAVAAGQSAVIASSLLLRSMHTQHSGDMDDSVSVVLEATNANTGTLSMMISSMRDVLSTVQLERCPDFRSPSQDDIYAVRLLKVIGRGGQGMVFQGQLYNTVVAVKIIPSSEEGEAAATGHPAVAAAADSAPGGNAGNGGGEEAERQQAEKLQQRQKRWLVRDALEVAVTSTVSHPHIVQVLNFFTDALVVEYSNEHGRYRLLPREESPNAKGSANTAIVMEYCDAGTLKHAVDSGCFRLSRGSNTASTSVDMSSSSGGMSSGIAASTLQAVNLASLLTSLLEVASGLRHLHEQRLVHCDIKPSNVLLRSCAADVRGWTCKLSDFGCVRLMNNVDPATGKPAFHSLSPVGSLSYMSPESMFRDTLLDASIDIYSFGIMMWECAMRQLPYTGVPAQQLPNLVRRGLRPSFHPTVPQDFRQVACHCWAQDPRRRPTAAALVRLLQRILTNVVDESLPDPMQPAPMSHHNRRPGPDQVPAAHPNKAARPASHSHQHQHHGDPQQQRASLANSSLHRAGMPEGSNAGNVGASGGSSSVGVGAGGGGDGSVSTPAGGGSKVLREGAVSAMVMEFRAAGGRALEVPGSPDLVTGGRVRAGSAGGVPSASAAARAMRTALAGAGQTSTLTPIPAARGGGGGGGGGSAAAPLPAGSSSRWSRLQQVAPRPASFDIGCSNLPGDPRVAQQLPNTRRFEAAGGQLPPRGQSQGAGCDAPSSDGAC